MNARCSPEDWRELGERLRNQCIVARWLGEQAVGIVRRELAQAWEAGRVTSRSSSAAPAPAAAEGDAASGTTVDVDVDSVMAVAEPLDDVAVVASPAAIAAPFEGYDTLPANHIVQRLRRMSADELRNTGAYESAHRNRSTVVGMVEQLLADATVG